MKRSLFLILATLLAFGTLTACSDDDDDPETTDDATDDTSADVTPDTAVDVTPDVTPVTNACTDADNTAAFAAYATSSGDDCDSPSGLASDAALSACSALACAGGDCSEEQIQTIVDCIVAEVSETTGIDAACGSCYGQLSASVIGNCVTSGCADPSSEACGICIEDSGFNADLEACSGLDSDYTPCPAE